MKQGMVESIAGLSLLFALAACGGGGSGDGENVAALPAGSLDTSFDTDGKVATDLGSDFDEAAALALQPDGKIVVVGYTNLGSSGDDFAVVRYNLDGSLDTSFDLDGKVRTDFTGGSDIANAVAIQPSDGKIVVAGTSRNASNEYVFALARYETNGGLDTGFGAGGAAGDGKVRTPFGGTFSVAYAVAIQSDGKIVAAGITDSGGTQDFALARYHTDGKLDLSFGPNGDGKVTTDFGGEDDGAYAVAIQSDGKIVAAGFSLRGANEEVALARYNTDGSLDTSFGTGGMITIAAANQQIYALAIQPDGKIVAAGYSGATGIRSMYVVRFLSNGNLDTPTINNPGFGLVGGQAYVSFSGDSEVRGVAVQPDGKIVVTGYGTGDIAFARLDGAGVLDPSFGVDGKTTIDLGAIGKAVAIQPDGKIVAVASPVVTASGNDFALVRINP